MSARESTYGIELDRARIGPQRETFGHEATLPKGSRAVLRKSAQQRLRAGHSWVGLDKEAVVHDDDGVTSRVTLTHWKDQQLDTSAARAERLRDEAHALTDQWLEAKSEVRKLEDDKGVVYDELCVSKYRNTDLLAQCLEMEQKIRDERVRKKKIEVYITGLAKEIEAERAVTDEVREKADFLLKAREKLLRERDDLGCCAECCTACCWEENGWTKFCVVTVPLIFGSQHCKCQGEKCCQKGRLVKSLDIDVVYHAWEKALARKNQAIFEQLAQQAAFDNAHKL
jgi:hypothetical protein